MIGFFVSVYENVQVACVSRGYMLQLGIQKEDRTAVRKEIIL